LILRYATFAEGYYRKAGRSTGEHVTIKNALRPMEEMFGDTPAINFGPKRLKEVRAEMIRRDWSRRYINAPVSRIKRFFSWCVEEELVPGEVVMNLRPVRGLRKDRSNAREKPEIVAVRDEDIETILRDPYLSPMVRELIALQRRTGMRPGEALSMTVEAIDRSDQECWAYSPSSHKSQHRGKLRVICIGPKARGILLPRLVATGTGRLYPIRLSSYHRALRRACDRAGVPRFAPNDLRHSFATEVRKASGLEAVQVALGHSNAKTSEIYAETDLSKAREVARLVG
jgi:integrase